MPTHFQVEPNFIATQVQGRVPFSIDVVFESASVGPREQTFKGDVYTQALKWHMDRFDRKFEDIFNLQQKGCVICFLKLIYYLFTMYYVGLNQRKLISLNRH